MAERVLAPVARGVTFTVFGLIAILLMAVAGHVAWSRVQFLTHAETAEGVVEAIPYGGSHPTIAFVTGAGVRVRYMQGGMIAGFRPGDVARVHYLPESAGVDPVVDHWGAMWGTSALLAGLSLCFAGASVQAYPRRRGISSGLRMKQPSVPTPESSWITIGSMNQSESGHHYYLFHLDSRRPDKPFCFEESVGGGPYSGGGAIGLARSELEGWSGNWREHVKRAGCEWVVPIIEASQDQQAIVAEISRESNRLKRERPNDR